MLVRLENGDEKVTSVTGAIAGLGVKSIELSAKDVHDLIDVVRRHPDYFCILLTRFPSAKDLY